MAAESDSFVIATFAIWAGDFRYYERLLKDFSPEHLIRDTDDEIDEPEDILRDTGARRLRQFRQKRKEFKQLLRHYQLRDFNIVDQPAVVETTHLRGTIWRNGEREFVMQGYLKDLSWEKVLFSLARAHAETLGTPVNSKSKPPTFELPGEAFDGKSYRSRGCLWVLTGNPFIQVQLTELGLLEARGLWVERNLPADAQSITEPFLQILESLDPISKEDILRGNYDE